MKRAKNDQFGVLVYGIGDLDMDHLSIIVSVGGFT
jgi:hypothetical protein